MGKYSHFEFSLQNIKTLSVERVVFFLFVLFTQKRRKNTTKYDEAGEQLCLLYPGGGLLFLFFSFVVF